MKLKSEKLIAVETTVGTPAVTGIMQSQGVQYARNGVDDPLIQLPVDYSEPIPNANRVFLSGDATALLESVFAFPFGTAPVPPPPGSALGVYPQRIGPRYTGRRRA